MSSAFLWVGGEAEGSQFLILTSALPQSDLRARRQSEALVCCCGGRQQLIRAACEAAERGPRVKQTRPPQSRCEVYLSTLERFQHAWPRVLKSARGFEVVGGSVWGGSTVMGCTKDVNLKEQLYLLSVHLPPSSPSKSSTSHTKTPTYSCSPTCRVIACIRTESNGIGTQPSGTLDPVGSLPGSSPADINLVGLSFNSDSCQ